MNRERRWLIYDDTYLKAVMSQFGLTRQTAVLIRNRGVFGLDQVREYLYGSTESLHDPHLMKGCEEAAALLLKKIREKKKIRIIGDYDADGVNATYVFFRAIRTCGGNADYAIPDRLKDGYGLNASLVEAAAKEGVDTILTCDNGTGAVDAVALAKERGMSVIVTDHHELGETLPPADVIVNPHQPDCPYPYKELCGAGVAWKVVCVLYEMAGRSQEEANKLLSYAGFATIEDIVDLNGENRILAREALERLSRGENPGYAALCRVNEADPSDLNAYRVGYVLGPCINAAGRLGSADLALDLLLAEDAARADEIAGRLKKLNDERKEMTDQAFGRAVDEIEADASFQADRVLVIYLSECHEGIIGIVAGRIREKYYKPTFVLTDSSEAGVAKGSGRSIDAYSMFDEMKKCSDVFLQFGGHPMAAGFSIRTDRIEELRRRLNASCTLTKEELTEELLIDYKLSFGHITKTFVNELTLLEPTGKANPSPLFAQSHVGFQKASLIGKDKNSVKLKAVDPSGALEALLFYEAEEFVTFLAKKFGVKEVLRLFAGSVNHIELDLAYYPEINSFRGEDSIQIIIKNYRVREEEGHQQMDNPTVFQGDSIYAYLCKGVGS